MKGPYRLALSELSRKGPDKADLMHDDRVLLKRGRSRAWPKYNERHAIVVGGAVVA